MSRVTIKDIARRARVSFQTVSLVLNHPEKVALATRDAVTVAINEMGYVPNVAARSLRNVPSRTLACIYFRGTLPYDDSSQLMQDTNQGIIVQTLARIADRHGHTMLQRILPDDSPASVTQVCALFAEGRVDGAIVLPERDDDPVAAALHARKFNYLAFGLALKGRHYVARSEDQAIHDVVTRLIGTGCRRIAFIRGERGERPNPISAQRFAGYRDGLAAAKLPFAEELAVIGDWTSANGYRLTERLLALDPPPDAIIASNDRVAYGVLKALHERAVKVPDEVSVVGFDNFAIDDFTIPSLTSVHMPTLEMAEFAVEHVIGRINNIHRGRPVCKVFATGLVERDSTRRIIAEFQSVETAELGRP